MKALPILLALGLALTAVALAPTGTAACAITNTPVVSGTACTDRSCHYDVLQGTLTVECRPLP